MSDRHLRVGRSSRRRFVADTLHALRLLGPLSRLRHALAGDLCIVAYHRVLDVDDEDAFDFDLDLVSASRTGFRAQMRLLRERFNPVRFADVAAALDGGPPLPPRAVIVTFDDGYDDNYRCAFPILRELGVPAMFFVSTGHIESGLAYAYDWFVHMLLTVPVQNLRIDELDLDIDLPETRVQRRLLGAAVLDRMKAVPAEVQGAVIARLEVQWNIPRARGHADCRPMSWDQLREMHAAGMEVGSHGVWHHMLARLDDASMRAEVIASRQAIGAALGAPCEVISYPVGGFDAYDGQVLAAVREAGYALGCSYVSGTNRLPPAEPFALRRLAVERHMDEAWFAALVGLPEAFSYPSRRRVG
ncbi:polysaccharide deacetylase family protein [Dokdonella sp.]|nr:polysaccharide deacetylase family protein [Dokdonella sp.]MBX3691665.1 polysaccharide deacetylase family protein [Dokdonella sp.]MCW5567398.1 polysaccharide deacetylase family protein [Dokdonella sp.]